MLRLSLIFSIAVFCFSLAQLTACKEGPKDGPSLKSDGPMSPNTPDAPIFANYDLSFITDGFLRKWSESGGGAAREEMEVQEEWIDFKEDGTYERGALNKTTGYGIWNFNPGNSRIQMTDDDSHETKSEFRISRGGDRLAFMGTETYNNEDVVILFNRMHNTVPQQSPDK